MKPTSLLRLLGLLLVKSILGVIGLVGNVVSSGEEGDSVLLSKFQSAERGMTQVLVLITSALLRALNFLFLLTALATAGLGLWATGE